MPNASLMRRWGSPPFPSSDESARASGLASGQTKPLLWRTVSGAREKRPVLSRLRKMQGQVLQPHDIRAASAVWMPLKPCHPGDSTVGGTRTVSFTWIACSARRFPSAYPATPFDATHPHLRRSCHHAASSKSSADAFPLAAATTKVYHVYHSSGRPRERPRWPSQPYR